MKDTLIPYSYNVHVTVQFRLSYFIQCQTHQTLLYCAHNLAHNVLDAPAKVFSEQWRHSTNITKIEKTQCLSLTSELDDNLSNEWELKGEKSACLLWLENDRGEVMRWVTYWRAIFFSEHGWTALIAINAHPANRDQDCRLNAIRYRSELKIIEEMWKNGRYTS